MILNLSDGSPNLLDLLRAIEGLHGGNRVGVRDLSTGNLFRIQGVLYDSNRMALIFQIDATKPIVLNPV